MPQLIVPSRYEFFLENDILDGTPTILPVEADLRSFLRLREKARTQRSGVLSFLTGGTGAGKTTSVFSASAHLADEFCEVVRVPVEEEFRNCLTWLRTHLPAATGRSLLVLFDGREVTDDAVGLHQLMTGLNQLLRQRSDVVFVWPTNDSAWHNKLRTLARTIGGSNFAPEDADIVISGPSKEQWPDVLERILIQLDLSLADVGIAPEMLREVANREPTVGEFLGSIGDVIARRLTKERDIKGLPNLLFVITSGEEVTGEANRIRRAGTHVVKAQELLAYSPRSSAGKWWKARLATPEHHLAYVVSLFNARLATMTSSAVGYAMLHYGTARLQQAAAEGGLTPHLTNARITISRTDLYRILNGEDIPELTSSRKGKTGDASRQSYANIQGMSAKHHKEINQALVTALADDLDQMDLKAVRYEVDAGDQNLYTDAIAPMAGQDIYLEFHHLSEANCKASSMASYIMDKLRVYAIHYNLIPR